MENSTSIEIAHVLILVLTIGIVGMASGKLASRLKMPDVALFVIAGIIVGPGLHLINESSTSLTNQMILTVGSVLILFDGGRHIELKGIGQVWITLSILSVPGVLITAVIVGATAHFLLGLPIIYSLLIGAIIAPTDPATLIPIFKQVKVKKRVRETVESESAFNDATASILTTTIVAVIAGTHAVSAMSSILDFLKSAGGGIVIGAVIGLVASYLAAHFRLGILRDYTTIAMILTALSSYLVSEHFGFSGFMSTFVAGLIWGNSELFGLNMTDKLHEMFHFSENITVLLRMMIFILLGSQVHFHVISKYALQGIGVILVFMFIARPLTILASTLPDRKAKWSWKEILFMFWVRETGVIPAALSGMVAGMGIAHSDVISSVVFLAVLITIIVQASTTPYLARKLGLEVKPDFAGTDLHKSDD